MGVENIHDNNKYRCVDSKERLKNTALRMDICRKKVNTGYFAFLLNKDFVF